MRYAAAVDIGGTNTRVALIGERYEIEQIVRFPTDTEDPYHTMEQTAAAVRSFRKEICGAGISCPGPLDLLNGTVLTPPNLHGRWHGLAIARELSNLLGVLCRLENDANLAALAEARVGEGKGCRIVQFLTLSTGVGGGLVINGKIFRGAHGFANEIANTCLVPDGPSHGSIYPGGLEALCSGTAIETRARRAGLAVSHAGDVAALAEAGDPQAGVIMAEAKNYLANYLAGVQAYIDPDIIILGGSVALKIPGFTEEVEALVRTKVYPSVVPFVKIRNSLIGENNGLLGAACLAFEEET